MTAPTLPQAQAMPRNHRHGGVVRRVDHVEPETEVFVERQVLMQILRWQADFGDGCHPKSSTTLNLSQTSLMSGA